MKKAPVPRGPGRPRTNPLPRAEQLRIAKRAQRARDRQAGLVLCQLKVRPPLAEKLHAAAGLHGLDERLERFLDDAIVDVRRYPNLALLCWNRTDRFLTDRDAFGLYERNWRFVDTKRMPREERKLIGRLAAKYGNGVLNV